MSVSGGHISGRTGFKREGYKKSYKESLTGRGFRAVQTFIRLKPPLTPPYIRFYSFIIIYYSNSPYSSVD